MVAINHANSYFLNLGMSYSLPFFMILSGLLYVYSYRSASRHTNIVNMPYGSVGAPLSKRSLEL
jgi:hypothetical protein